MSRLNILAILFDEFAAPARGGRVPEPQLIMDDPGQVEAYANAGREGGSLAPLYLFNSSQIAEVVRPGDVVVDLACGPANQLAQAARLLPDAHFVGIDLSPTMLDQARQMTTWLGLSNVEFRQGDITDLQSLRDGSVDVVLSTLSLHHLPHAALLERALAEAARILKAPGGVYLADLGRLRSERTIERFARQYADVQPEVFTADYRNSMRAAFSLAEFRAAARAFRGQARVFSTFLVPYMIIVKGDRRRPYDAALHARFGALSKALSPHQRADLRRLRQFFRLGGLASRYLD